MKRNILPAALVALAFMTTGCGRVSRPEVDNVIYLIGDGMGLGAVTSLLASEDSLTGFEQAPIVGLSETCSANNYVDGLSGRWNSSGDRYTYK